MCLICDGMSWEDYERRQELAMQVYGWLLTSIEPEPERGALGWHYTVGLSENFGVPDLLVIDEPDFIAGGRALRLVAESVVDRGWDMAEVAAVSDFGLRPLDWDILSEDTLVDWEERYGRLPQHDEMVQLLLPGAASRRAA